MTQVQFFLSNNNRIKAIDLLCAHKCDVDLASEIVQQLACNESYIDQYIIDSLNMLLPKDKLVATKSLSIYYEIRFSYAKKIIEAIIAEKGNLENRIKKALEELNPATKHDIFQKEIKGSATYQSKLLQLIVDGKDEEGADLIMKSLHLAKKDASIYMEEFRESLLRREN